MVTSKRIAPQGMAYAVMAFDFWWGAQRARTYYRREADALADCTPTARWWHPAVSLVLVNDDDYIVEVVHH